MKCVFARVGKAVGAGVLSLTLYGTSAMADGCMDHFLPDGSVVMDCNGFDDSKKQLWKPMENLRFNFFTRQVTIEDEKTGVKTTRPFDPDNEVLVHYDYVTKHVKRLTVREWACYTARNMLEDREAESQKPFARVFYDRVCRHTPLS